MSFPDLAIRKILVPVNFTELSRHALDVACQLAEKCGAILKLVNVTEIPLAGSGSFYSGIEMNPITSYQSFDLILPDLLDQGREQLNQMTRELQEKGILVEQEIVAGTLSSLMPMIAEEQIDLVIIGSPGSNGLEEFLIGSDAEELVRQCPCPVLTIKQKHTPFQVQSILFPSDLSPELKALVPYLHFFEHFFGAQLNLLYVQTKGDQATDANIHARMQEFITENKLSRVNLIIQPNASASGGIVEVANELAHDLILMPTHGNSGWLHLFHKSITERVVNHATIPVLTFHWPQQSH